MLKHRQQNQIRASYFQLMEQHLHIEVWDYNRLWFNSFVGYESIELMAIADGTTRQTVNIYDKIDKAGVIEMPVLIDSVGALQLFVEN